MAYEKVGFSGEQYVLEKGVYRNCDDWGTGNSALASLQPVLQVRASRAGRGPGGGDLGLGEEPTDGGRGWKGWAWSAGRGLWNRGATREL